ncbi:MAG TPA: hypothetical protein VGN95_04290 [Pyrinomonadaceae bacterium]|nr:hypothetical protein [Pyrinomonadaceae bacterium]
MRKIIRASVLVLALAIPAFADDIPNGVTSTGNIPNGVVGEIPNNATGDIPYGIASAFPQASIAEVWISLFYSLIQ